MRFKDTHYGDLTGQTYIGDIDVFDMGLTSLEGAPKIVRGGFYCSNNNLTTLEGAPEVVEESFFFCSYNYLLSSLKGAPKKVKNFYCDNSGLTSLEGAPEIVEGQFNCSYNKLTTLKGAPKKVKSFYCANNQLVTLEGAPEIVEGTFVCSSNYKLTSLKGAPKIVNGEFYCKGTNLISLEYLPKTVIVTKKLISDFSEEEVYEFFKSDRPEVLI
jgi:hypothetical protein